MLRNQIISLRSGKTKVKMKVNQTEKIENLVANPEGHFVVLYYVGVDLNGIIVLLGTGTAPFCMPTSPHLTG